MSDRSLEEMPLKGARYTGVRHVAYKNASEDMHIVSVDHPAGEWDAIYCKTQWQAEAIVSAVRSRLSPVQGEDIHVIREATKEEKEHDCCGDRYPCNVAFSCSCGVKFCRQDMLAHLLKLHQTARSPSLDAPSAVQGEELPERPKKESVKQFATMLSGISFVQWAEFVRYADKLEAEIGRLKGERDLREEHDKSARISCTTLEPYTKPLDDMSDAELKEALEYSETCGCVFCFHNGYLFRLRSALSSSRAEALKEALDAVQEGHEFAKMFNGSYFAYGFISGTEHASKAILARMEKAW